MGNYQFKTDFDAENITGKLPQPNHWIEPQLFKSERWTHSINVT